MTAAAKNVGMWHRGSRGERKHSITPGDLQTSANPTCSVDLKPGSVGPEL